MCPIKEVTIEKTFCTTREAAGLLGVSIGTVQVWVESGLLRAWKTAGGHRRVLRASIDYLLCKSEGDAVTEAVMAAPVDRARLAPRARALRVMVVEDDKNLLRLYQSQLSFWPMAPLVSLANSGIIGLLMMGRSHPDLLIADLNMPGMDGFTMLRGLRQAPEMCHTRMVAVTGLDAAAMERSGGVPEGVEVLPKPVPFDRLKAIATELAESQAVFQQEAAL
jgi:excisionase family DNA binding protein